MINKVVLSSDEIVYKKDELALSFYYIIQGSVNLVENNCGSNYVCKHVLANSFLGVCDFFSEGVRSYTAMCSEDVELELIDENNLDSFISNNSIKSFNLLNQLSDELQLLNEELINRSSTKCFNNEKSFTISKVENDFVIDTERIYRKSIPSEHVNYLFDKDVECPVCKEKFKVNQIRYSKLKVKNSFDDGRKTYEGIDDLWYQIWRCPVCNYSNFINSFYKINNKLRIELKSTLPSVTNEVKLIKTSINDVFEDYFYLSKTISKITKSSFLKARLWQSIAWLLEDVNDTANLNKAKRILRSYYEDAWYNSTDYINPNDEAKLTMKIAMLYLEENDIKSARDYLLKGTQIKAANKILRQQISDKLILIKQNMISEKN